MRGDCFILAESMKNIPSESHGESKASHAILGWIFDMPAPVDVIGENNAIFKGVDVLVIFDLVGEFEVFHDVVIM
jgi:hypothetical protein